MPRTKKVKENEELTKDQITAALVNTPEVATDELKLGERTFKILDLKYKDYTAFLGLVLPLVDSIGSGLRSGGSMLESISVADLFYTCTNNLPKLAHIVLRQSEPEITVEQVEELCGDPLTMAEVVMAQISHNKMIERFGSFFGKIAAMMKR
jgi:hypothetical protein